jgi:phage-related protein
LNSTYSFPLERAIQLNHYRIVKLLLDHDAQRSMSWTYPKNAKEFVVEVTGGQGAVHNIMVRALEKEERTRWRF